MSNLLASGFTRLFKSSMFRACNLFMGGFAFFVLYNIYWHEINSYPDMAATSPDEILLTGAFYISLVIAVFIGSFIGTEYKDGTIRNKLAIGHSRIVIYFSNLVVCIAASLIMHVVWLVIVIIGGLLLIGNFEMSAGSIAGLILISFFTMAAYTAIFLLVCMLITSKSTASVAVLILALILMELAVAIYYRLDEKKYYGSGAEPEQTQMILNEDGTAMIVKYEYEINPDYLEGMKRKVFVFLNDLLPDNQIYQLSEGVNRFLEDEGEKPDHSAWFPLYSIAIIIVTTTAGIIMFQKKDLK